MADPANILAATGKDLPRLGLNEFGTWPTTGQGRPAKNPCQLLDFFGHLATARAALILAAQHGVKPAG